MPNNGKFRKDIVDIKGFITEVQRIKGDVFALLSITDEKAGVSKKDSRYRFPRRIPHQIPLWFMGGETENGIQATVKTNDKVHVTGYLRNIPISETIASFRHNKEFNQIDDQVTSMGVMRDVAYLVVNTLTKVID